MLIFKEKLADEQQLDGDALKPIIYKTVTVEPL